MTALLPSLLAAAISGPQPAVNLSLPDTLTAGEQTVCACPIGKRDADVRFMVTDLHNLPEALYGRRLRRNPGWSVVLKSADGAAITLSLKSDETDFDGVSTSQAVNLSAYADGSPKPLWSKKVPGHLGAPGAPEAFTLLRRGGHWQAATAAAGHRAFFGDIDLPANFSVDSIGAATSAEGKIILNRVDITMLPAPADLHSEWSGHIDRLHDYLTRSVDPLEGYWYWFDATIDEDLLRPGGDYRLAIVRNPADLHPDGPDDFRNRNYHIIYLDGAKIERHNWTEGMIKGELTPTAVGGVYNLTWYDSSMLPMSHSIKASVDRNMVITISFPYQQTQVRLHKSDR